MAILGGVRQFRVADFRGRHFRMANLGDVVLEWLSMGRHFGNGHFRNCHFRMIILEYFRLVILEWPF